MATTNDFPLIHTGIHKKLLHMNEADFQGAVYSVLIKYPQYDGYMGFMNDQRLEMNFPDLIPRDELLHVAQDWSLDLTPSGHGDRLRELGVIKSEK